MKDSFDALKKHPEALFVIGYMLFPLLALVAAVLGFFLVLGGHKIFGLIMLLVPTQLFIFGAYWAIKNRKALLENQ
ncbi:NF038396 family protein [Glutamicibacter endophyticus]|uniref:NF038396 family protein n=1 Tax=Glutamicibacter endophyticus TaxID=1522174 RepID=UPI003AF1C91E